MLARIGQERTESTPTGVGQTIRLLVCPILKNPRQHTGGIERKRRLLPSVTAISLVCKMHTQSNCKCLPSCVHSITNGYISVFSVPEICYPPAILVFCHFPCFHNLPPFTYTIQRNRQVVKQIPEKYRKKAKKLLAVA